MLNKLPTSMQALYKALPPDGADVGIVALYRVVFPLDADVEEHKLRDVQQKLGVYITRLNRRLREANQIVRPGARRGTYHLTLLKEPRSRK